MQSRPSRPARAFTLIELLVVISIIAILASLALPALNSALNAAKKAQVNSMISQLKVGLTAFNTEYGTWPLSKVDDSIFSTTDLQNLYHVLIGDTTGAQAANGNTRQIVFMEFTNKDTDAVGQTPATTFLDPWTKTTKQNYNIQVDGDFDNQITPVVGNASEPAPQTTPVNASVIIWDAGPPRSGKTVNTDTTKYLKSW